MKPFIVPPDYKSAQDIDESFPPAVVYNSSCCSILMNGKLEEPGGGGKTPLRRSIIKSANISSVKLSIAQGLWQPTIFSLQVALTYWSIFVFEIGDVSNNLKWWIFNLVNAGIVTLVIEILGLMACQRNTECLIMGYTLLNPSDFLLVISSVTVANLSTLLFYENNADLVGIAVDRQYCGEEFIIVDNEEVVDVVDKNGVSHERTTAVPVMFLANHAEQQFYCEDALFTLWVMLDYFMTVFSMVMISSIMWLYLLHSEAVCPCCSDCSLSLVTSKKAMNSLISAG